MNILSKLSATKTSGLESTAEITESAYQAIDRAVSKGLISQLDKVEREKIAETAREGVEAYRGITDIKPVHKMALEVIVITTGRPALPTKDGTFDPADLNPEDAAPELVAFQDLLPPVIKAVGRIDLAGVHIGTGFVIAPGLILTNRHVAEVIGKAYSVNGGEKWLLKAGGLMIDFCREEGSTRTQRHRITGVHSTGPQPILMEVKPERLDAAILRVEPKSIEGDDLPQAIPILDAGSPGFDDGGDIVSIGYPGSPQYEPSGSQPSQDDQKILAALKRIFHLVYGVKRVSPGRILSRPGRIPDGGHSWAFTHDATTLAGASGSCVVRTNGGKVLGVGLHFGGAWLKHNFAHFLPALKGDFLTDVPVDWKL